jgi:hypothetical protein
MPSVLKVQDGLRVATLATPINVSLRSVSPIGSGLVLDSWRAASRNETQKCDPSVQTVDVSVSPHLSRWVSRVWGRDGFQKTFSTRRTSLLPSLRFSAPTSW